MEVADVAQPSGAASTLPSRGPAPPGTPPAALSTMWAVQPRFVRNMGAFLDRAGELGYGAIEINHSMDAEQSGAILGYHALPVTGVHAPAPLERHPSRGWNRELNLASEDEEERGLAVMYHQRSLTLAADAGARVVVVHLGSAGSRMLEGERRLRSMYERRERLGEEWNRTVDATIRERAARARPGLERARRSVEELADAALKLGVTLGLETRLHYHEFPQPTELADILEGVPPEVAGYVHDVGHAEVQHRLGLTDRSAWWDLLGPRLVGLHLHDVRGLVDHRAPGNGDVDFTWLAERIREANPEAARTCEIDQHEPDEAVQQGIKVLRTAGVIAGD